MKRLTTTLLLLSVHIIFTFAQEQKVRLLFAGDAMMHKRQIQVSKQQEFDFSNYFTEVEDQIKEADISVINFETTLAGKPYTGYPTFCSPDAFAKSLHDAGFNLFLTSNNHCIDKGKKGLDRTIKILDLLGVTHTGTFKNQTDRNEKYPLMMSHNGINIAMLNYTYATNGIDTPSPFVVNRIDKSRIKADIAQAKNLGADIIVANMHWGVEYKLYNSTEQRQLANFLIKNGVRLIIGNHPHVVQPMDINRKDGQIESVVVYSLGNFCSDMKPTNMRGSMMAHIEISKDENSNIHIKSCDYSLVWMHKAINEYGQVCDFQVLPVEKYNNAEGIAKLGIADHTMMRNFVRKAKQTIEKNWTE